MTDYIISEAELSGDEYDDQEIVEPISDKDVEFIDDSGLQDKEDVDFYHKIRKKLCYRVMKHPNRC